MERGEVWWANLPAPAGRRPVVLLSCNVAYAVRTSVTVAPVTQTIRGISSEVPLGRSDGMPRRCVVNLDDVLTIPMVIVTDRISHHKADARQDGASETSDAVCSGIG